MLSIAAVGSIVIAALNSFSLSLVLPLVDVATDSGAHSTPVRLAQDVFGTSNRGTLKLDLSVAIVVLFVLKDLGSVAFMWWSSTFINVERVEVSARILEHYLTAPFSEMSRRSAAELMRTMDASVLQVFTYTVGGLINFLSGVFSVLSVIVVLFALAPIPTLTLVVYLGIAGWLYLKLLRRRSTLAGSRMNDASKQGWRTAFAALGAMKEVNLRGSHRHFVEGFRAAQLEGAYAGRTAQVLGVLPTYFLEVCFISAVGLAIGLSSNSAGGSGALSQVALFVAAGFRTLPSLTMLLSSISMLRIGHDSVRLVADELAGLGDQSQSTLPSVPDVAVPAVGWKRIEIDHVTFAYPSSAAPVLRDVSLGVPRGTSLALVGPSGAGKTTLVDVILGLHVPAVGTITVDGIDIRSCRNWWRGVVGYVPQDVYVLDASLAENVGFDLPRDAIDDEQLAKALQGAQLEDVVAGLPDGVNTWLGERGVRLSGGQRQRVGIARALYRNPELLVLDEATSALDNETEHRVASMMHELSGSVTLVVVAHRLSTVRTVDQVAFVKDGRVEAVGSFEAVEAMNDDFARLVALGTL